MNAQRNTRNNTFYVGNFHVTPITEEEYQEILSAVGKEYEIYEGNYIIYMHSAPSEILSKYAKKVRANEFHSALTVEELEYRIRQLRMDLGAIKELESLII